MNNDLNPQNITSEAPELQRGKIIQGKRFKGFSFSQQGESHVQKNTPCQDYNDFRYVTEVDVVISAISDGVGSCELSHWGSYTVVNSVLDYLERETIRKASTECDILDDDNWIYETLITAFRYALESVNQLAINTEKSPELFHCTLTVAVYDGERLWCCHAGDDGVVAQFQDGFVKLVTTRQKGEEASSVFPLQSGEQHWEISKIVSKLHGPVAAVIMATDGVLDAFVFDDSAYVTTEGCCNGVYYPFMQDAVYDEVHNTMHPEKRLDEYCQMMAGKDYRNRVTDDLTFMSVVCHDTLKQSKIPYFDSKIWQQVTQDLYDYRMAKLYGTDVGEKQKQVEAIPDDEVLIKETEEKNSDLSIPETKVKKVKRVNPTLIIAAALLVLGIVIGICIALLFNKKEPIVEVESSTSLEIKETLEETVEEIIDETATMETETAASESETFSVAETTVDEVGLII